MNVNSKDQRRYLISRGRCISKAMKNYFFVCSICIIDLRYKWIIVKRNYINQLYLIVFEEDFCHICFFDWIWMWTKWWRKVSFNLTLQIYWSSFANFDMNYGVCILNFFCFFKINLISYILISFPVLYSIKICRI